MRHLESKLQQYCVKWFRIQYPKVIIFAIPNGGFRNALEAKILRAEGVLSGVADLLVLKSNTVYNGLFIEMKNGKNKQTELQEHFEDYCTRNKYAYFVCRSFDEFKTIVETYLN